MMSALPLGVSSLLTQTISNLPVILVGALQSTGAAGQFSAAMKLVFFALMIDRVLFAIFLPVAARTARADQTRFSRVIAVGIRLVLLVCTPLVVTGIALAPLAIEVVYGAGYEHAVVPFRVLTGYFGLTVLNTIFMCALLAMDREKDFVRATAVGTAILVVLCLLLPSLLGVTGTAVGLTLAEAAITVMLLMRVRQLVRLDYGRIFMPAAAAAAGMVATLILFQSVHPVLAVLAGTTVFVALGLLFGGLPKDDWRFLRERLV
jgi:O-antigen/teichoic acid export membrane protein